MGQFPLAPADEGTIVQIRVIHLLTGNGRSVEQILARFYVCHPIESLGRGSVPRPHLDQPDRPAVRTLVGPGCDDTIGWVEERRTCNHRAELLVPALLHRNAPK